MKTFFVLSVERDSYLKTFKNRYTAGLSNTTAKPIFEEEEKTGQLHIQTWPA